MSEVPDPHAELRHIVHGVMVDFNGTKLLPAEALLCSQVMLFATIENVAASAAGLPRPTEVPLTLILLPFRGRCYLL